MIRLKIIRDYFVLCLNLSEPIGNDDNNNKKVFTKTILFQFLQAHIKNILSYRRYLIRK
jgi:hypothetical protein